jgi:hypothetical protein
MQEEWKEHEIQTKGISERIEKMIESGQYTENPGGGYTIIDPDTGSKVLLSSSSVEGYKKEKK